MGFVPERRPRMHPHRLGHGRDAVHRVTDRRDVRGGCVDRDTRAPSEALAGAPCGHGPGRRRARGRLRRRRCHGGERRCRGACSHPRARAGGRDRRGQARAPGARAGLHPGGQEAEAHALLGRIRARRAAAVGLHVHPHARAAARGRGRPAHRSAARCTPPTARRATAPADGGGAGAQLSDGMVVANWPDWRDQAAWVRLGSENYPSSTPTAPTASPPAARRDARLADAHRPADRRGRAPRALAQRRRGRRPRRTPTTRISTPSPTAR